MPITSFIGACAYGLRLSLLPPTRHALRGVSPRNRSFAGQISLATLCASPRTGENLMAAVWAPVDLSVYFVDGMDSSRVSGIMLPRARPRRPNEGGVQMEHTTIAVDLATSVFQIAVSHRVGQVTSEHRVRRSQMMPFFAQQPAATVLLEACGSAHHWAREFQRLGHTPRLLPAHDVQRYVRRNKRIGPMRRPCLKRIAMTRFTPSRLNRSSSRRSPRST